MISIKLKAKLEILYYISQSTPEINKETNKNKNPKSKNQDSLSYCNDKQTANIIYTKFENIPGFDNRISEVSEEEKEEIFTFLRSIDISIVNNIFSVLNSNQFFEKIKSKSGILIVRNYIDNIFNRINLLLNNENEAYLENNVNTEAALNHNYILNTAYIQNQNQMIENSKGFGNNIISKTKVINTNPIGSNNIYNTIEPKKSVNVNYSQLNNLNNKSNKTTKNIQGPNIKQSVNFTSNTKSNLNQVSYGNGNFNTNQNLMNNFTSNNPLLDNNNAYNSNNKRLSNYPSNDIERSICSVFSEIKLNDECEVFVYLNEFLNIDENDAIEIYDLFKYNQAFSVNENSLFILFYIISAYESLCLEEFFNLFSEEIFEFISGEQKFISNNRLKDLARLLGFNEFLLAKCCKELQINSSNFSSSPVNNANNQGIDFAKFKAFYLLLGKKFDMQTSSSLTNVSSFHTKKKGGRVNSDCFSKAK